MDVEKLLVKIFARGYTLSFGDYVLASGVKSSYYINFSYLANRPDYLSAISESLANLIRKKIGLNNFDKIVGVSNKGALFLPLLSISLDKPFSYFDKYDMKIVLGHINTDDVIVFVDDILNTGFTAERLYMHIKNRYGANMRYMVVILDREEGGVTRMKKYNVKVYSLIKMSKLSKILFEYGALSEEEYNIIIESIKKRGIK